MRYIIYGAGAVGGVVGGRLFQAGHEVVLIGRGAHLDAIRRDGLRLRTPDTDVHLPIPAVAHPRELDFRADDVVILTMKTQDTERALLDLEVTAGTEVTVVCCQNGVENERLVARRFPHVYGMLAWVPATFLEPGSVNGDATPLSAIIHLGCYPNGVDETAARIAADVSGSTMLSQPDPQVMRQKYTKLLSNLGNGIQAICGEQGDDDAGRRLSSLLRTEALACYAAAGIAYAGEEEYRGLVMAHTGTGPITGQVRGGGSTWQSLMRGTSVEVDYLNGEIVLLGRLHGVPTPANAVVRRLTNQMAAAGEKPGRYSLAEVLALAGEAPVSA